MTLITLVPDTGVQFYDIDLDIEAMPRMARSFWEEKLGTAQSVNGKETVLLRTLKEDETGALVSDTNVQPAVEETYTIGRSQAFEMHLNQWVPLPYFLLLPRGLSGQASFDRGPSNWARARLAPHPAPGPGRSHRLTLAFDTALVDRAVDGLYTGLSRENSMRQQEFGFAPALEHNSWLLDQVWVGTWLQELLVELKLTQRRGRSLRPEDMPHACEQFARYLTFLSLLDSVDLMPRVRVLDTVSPMLGYKPVAVDLVLDIGNARTCGILIEEHPDDHHSLNDSYQLVLRDLSRPELLHTRPFESRVEFNRASFGRETVAKRSGRASAFVWASPIRVGPEAMRLAGRRVGNEGATGLSSPKRYLWDERQSTQGWRYNGKAVDGSTTDPPVGGPFMPLLAEDGTVLRPNSRKSPAVRALFSRSSIFTFMLAEILLQALNQMNAPGNRAQRRDADKPRRLRSIILTMPPGMPVREQDLMRQRAAAAIQFTWALLGWSKEAQPSVQTNLDEATATQIVWLHNEVTERLQGDAGALMAMVGRARPEQPGGPCLRIASIDIGGGTTDLMVATYAMDGEAIIPKQEFRESFKIAGDDVLERVITRAVLPAIETALQRAGVADARALLARTLMQDHGGQSEQERQLRRLFVFTVLEPLGVAVLEGYEQARGGDQAEAINSTVAAILGADPAETERAFGYLEHAARAVGAAELRLGDVPIAVSSRHVATLVKSVLDPVLADLCEVIWQYDCDVLLLSGRPSRLAAVTNTVLAKMPVPPHRIIGMHRYRVGSQYPFRDASNRIEDPKTTAVVGAALCVQAEGRLRNFVLRTRNLKMRSTARYLGKMSNDGQIRRENELLTNVDLDGPLKDDVGFEIQLSTTTIIGFRQLPAERWSATPLYVMEFADPTNAQRLELPLKVRVRRRERTSDDEDDPTLHEDFQHEDVEDAAGVRQHERVVRLRLQTMTEQDGYWRDTGRLSLG